MEIVLARPQSLRCAFRPKHLKAHVMFNSAIFCRQRETHHRLLASEAVLDNARKVALTAAAAWAKEATEAEAREAGLVNQLSAADAEIAREFLDEDVEE